MEELSPGAKTLNTDLMSRRYWNISLKGLINHMASPLMRRNIVDLIFLRSKLSSSAKNQMNLTISF